jgi:hypothetical protein
MQSGAVARSLLLAGTMLGGATSAAMAAPVYTLLTTIAIPATADNNQGGKLTGFDISFADTTGYYYFADRSNASVDIINGNNLTAPVVQIPGFAGQQPLTKNSGPDGVLVAHTGGNAILFAGDAGSTLRTFNVNNPASPITGGTLNTGGTFRVDEMSFDPHDNLVMVANNADSPAFATLVNASLTPTTAHGNITIPGQSAAGGMEQSVWDPHTKTFFVSIPTFTTDTSGNALDAGGLAEIDAKGNVVGTINFTTLGVASCSPTGLGLGGSGNLMVGCSAGNSLVVNPTTGQIVTSVTGKDATVSGTDELWYDPVTGNFYVTGKDAAGDRVINVVNDTVYSVVDNIDLTALGVENTLNPHSVAVNPLNGDIFVPLPGTSATGTNTLCPNGCVAVFSAPEPSSLPLLAVGLAGLLGLGLRHRQH